MGFLNVVAPAVVGGGLGYLGAGLNADASKEAAAKNAAMQREFAQWGVRWKVADAQAAGIHPLYAMGANTHSFSPSYVGDSSMGGWLADTGQNISRAIAAGSTASERKLSDLQLEHARLQNDYLRERILSEQRQRSQVGPAFPSPSSDPYLSGQGDVGRVGGIDPRVIDEPLRRTVGDPSYPGKEAGAILDFNLARTAGGYAVIPAGEVKQRIEDDWLAEQQWKLRTYGHVLRGNIRLPDGRRALVNPLTGELVPISPFVEDVVEKFMDGPGGIWRKWRRR